MAQMKDRAIYDYAVQAGFSTSKKINGNTEAVVAVAIALAESGGRTDAHNDKPPDDSYGLWQINMIGGLGPEREERYNTSRRTLFNGPENARVAYLVFKDAGNSFRPWSTYTSGSYLRFLNRANEAAGNPIGPDVVTDVGEGVVEGVDAAGQILSFISDGKNWQRVGLFIGGGALLIVALIMWFNETGAGAQAAKLAGAVPGVGKVAKAATKVVK